MLEKEGGRSSSVSVSNEKLPLKFKPKNDNSGFLFWDCGRAGILEIYFHNSYFLILGLCCFYLFYFILCSVSSFL